MYKHQCTLETDAHRQEFSDMLRFTNISDLNPRTKLFFRSVASVRREKLRHARSKYAYIIHPLSLFRLYWDTLFCVLLYVSLVAIPITRFSFSADNPELTDPLSIAKYTFDFCCLLDVILMFLTGVCLPAISEVETHPKLIAWTNFKSIYFYIYLITSFPSKLPLLYTTLFSKELPNRGDVLAVTVLQCLKMARIYKFSEYYNNCTECLGNRFIRLYLKYFLVFVVFLHWLTCVFIYFFLSSDIITPERPFIHASFHVYMPSAYVGIELYLSALTIVVSFIFSYNLMSRYRKSLKYEYVELYSILAFIIVATIGYVFHSVITVYILQIVREVRHSQAKYQRVTYQVKKFCKMRSLGKDIEQQLLMYYEYRYRKSFFRESVIFNMLSENLRREIFVYTRHEMVENVTILKELPADIISNIVSTLHKLMFLCNDVIVRAGSSGDCMFFIANGTVAVSTPNGREICHLHDGGYFGEVALLNTDHKRIATVVAIEICEVYRLDKHDFRISFPPNSPHFKKMQQIAHERIEKTTLLEQLHLKYIVNRTKRVML